MTERLYYTAQGLLEFDAVVIETVGDSRQQRIKLDRSAFYPTSGGQQHDTGRLDECRVVDVIEDEAGDVVHLCDGPGLPTGKTVRGVIDADRRRRHRQVHSAQHLLSALLAREFQATTMSVHLGWDYGGIEIDRDQLEMDQLDQLEELAVDSIRENRPVEILMTTSDEARQLPLRKPPPREGKLRVVHIDGLDYSACGGTHVDRTGEILLIKLIGQDKMRGRALIKYLAGDQVVGDYAERFRITDRMSTTLTCSVADLPDRIEKLETEAREAKRKLAAAQKQLLPIQAEELATTAEWVGSYRLVLAAVDFDDAKLLPALGALAAELIGGVTILASGNRAVIASAEACPVDAGKIARELSTLLGLKGGGSARLANLGGGTAISLDRHRDDIKRLVAAS